MSKSKQIFPMATDGGLDKGLTKRELFAAMAMQGILANAWSSADAVETAVRLADKLLKKLEDTDERS